MALNKTYITLVGALTLLFASCVAEDMSGCLPPSGQNVHLTLRLADEVQTTATRYPRLSGYDITGVRVWAFDRDDRMVLYTAVPRNADGRYDIYMNLPAGEYDFVVWTGDGSAYKITSESELMRMMDIYLDKDSNGIIDSDIPDLLYGTVREGVVAAGVENHIEIEMRPNTYNINITASGMARSGEKWEVAIAVDHIHHTFDNDIVRTAEKLHHVRQGELNGSTSFTSHIRTLNITPDRHMRLILRNLSTGHTFFDEGLAETIISTYAANGRTPDFNRVYDYDIEMTFRPDPTDNSKLGVTITINGWQYIPQETGLG